MNIKTPGVYVQEISLFPPSVAEVATAIPAFIGYTSRKIDENGLTLTNNPIKISSFIEFVYTFGGPYVPEKYSVIIDTAKNNSIISSVPEKRFFLYDAIRQYFDNGGGQCYIVSVGDYSSIPSYTEIKPGIDAIAKFDEPTLIIFPDGVSLLDGDDNPDYSKLSDLHKLALAQAEKNHDRFVIMDLMQGNLKEGTTHKPISNFRENIGVNFLNFGAAYYPWIITNYNVDVDFRQLELKDTGDTDIDISTLFGASTNEGKLITELKSRISECDAVTFEKSGIKPVKLRAQGVELITETLSSIEKAIISSTGSTKQKFTDYISVYASMAVSFPAAQTALAAESPLKAVIDKLKVTTELLDALLKLAAYEKNPDIVAQSIATRNDAAVKAIYDKLNGVWLKGANFDDVTANATAFPNTKAGCIQAIQALKADVLQPLLSAYDALLTATVFNNNQSELKVFSQIQLFKGIEDDIIQTMQTIPPSGAIAGVYALTDNTRGVWKAPANVSLSAVIGPSVKIDNKEQEDLNVHTSGKSINAIRAFTGKGTLVWGARTLAGNDNEWRYIPVRRFFNMVEESVKKATEPFVFEPNDANTWTKVRAMIENFLIIQWRNGALQGSKPNEAFFVNVGLGLTMTADDIFNGRMIVEIGMAVVRPAEFIILRFSHKMMER